MKTKLKYILVYSIIIFFFGFKTQDYENNMIKVSSYSEKDTLIYNKNSKYVKYHFINNSQYEIYWGDSISNHSSKNLYELLGDGQYKIYEIIDSIYVLRQSCGSSCNKFLFLYKSGKEREVYNVKALNLKSKIIVYAVNNSYLIAESLIKNSKSSKIELCNFCGATNKSDCIESIKIQNDTMLKIRCYDQKDNIYSRSVTFKIP